jgi:hypothetical protein
MLAVLASAPLSASGGVCAGCTIVVGMLLGDSKPVPPPMLAGLCATSNTAIDGIGDVSGICSALADPATAQTVARLGAAGLSPDKICRDITLCKDEAAQCTLYTNVGAPTAVDAGVLTMVAKDGLLRRAQRLGGNVVDHRPFSDEDSDDYSTKPRLRGSNWQAYHSTAQHSI